MATLVFSLFVPFESVLMLDGPSGVPPDSISMLDRVVVSAASTVSSSSRRSCRPRRRRSFVLRNPSLFRVHIYRIVAVIIVDITVFTVVTLMSLFQDVIPVIPVVTDVL